MSWQELQTRFCDALDSTVGRSKSSSGLVEVSFSSEGVFVYMGCYDVSDWPRNLHLGPFTTEQEAFEYTDKKVDEAIEIVRAEHVASQSP